MSNTGRYAPISEAVRILNVSFERISWFIATSKLLSIKNPKDRNQKLVSLEDVYKLRALPHLLAPWIIYALVDPRDNSIRYIGRTNEPQTRLLQHLKSVYIENPAKYQWIQELKRLGLSPYIEVIEGVYGPLQDADAREQYWIGYFTRIGADLTNAHIQE